MNTQERDLLVLVKDEFASEKFMERELEKLNEMLFHYETIEKFCIVHELIDINKYKVVDQSRLMKHLMRRHELKPFQFVLNKN